MIINEAYTDDALMEILIADITTDMVKPTREEEIKEIAQFCSDYTYEVVYDFLKDNYEKIYEEALKLIEHRERMKSEI